MNKNTKQTVLAYVAGNIVGAGIYFLLFGSSSPLVSKTPKEILPHSNILDRLIAGESVPYEDTFPSLKQIERALIADGYTGEEAWKMANNIYGRLEVSLRPSRLHFELRGGGNIWTGPDDGWYQSEEGVMNQAQDIDTNGMIDPLQHIKPRSINGIDFGESPTQSTTRSTTQPVE